MIYLVRHAKAGDRNSWLGSDRLRPLTRPGQEQAIALLDIFENERFDRVVSSPYVRCMETVVPLAAEHGLPIEPHAALEEGAPIGDTLALLVECAPGGAVFSSHGDVIPELLGYLHAHEHLELGDDPRCAKGSVWVLDTKPDGTVIDATYWPAP